MKKTKSKCNHDCFNCKYDDCIFNGITMFERIEQLARDYSKCKYTSFKYVKHNKGKLKYNKN